MKMPAGKSSEIEQTMRAHAGQIHAMHLAWAAASFLLWRSYYFFTVVVIPALGWR